MKPRVTMVTLAVEDLERAVAFDRDGLGFSTEGIVGTEHEHGAVAFFPLARGLKLALWPRAGLAATEFALAHHVGTRAEVDSAMDEAARAGAANPAWDEGEE